MSVCVCVGVVCMLRVSVCLSVCVCGRCVHGTCVCVCTFRMDKLHMALTELCFAINYCSVITVWEHGFVPRDFFTQHLELRFNKYSLFVP